MGGSYDRNDRPAPDDLLVKLADYVVGYEPGGVLAYGTARYTLMDSIACAAQAFRSPEFTKLLGPTVPGTVVPNGARVLGTPYQLDPVKAAFDNGMLIRAYDHNDTWLAAEWGHPSDNYGAILALADYLSRVRLAQGKKPLLVHDVLEAAIKAYEIQGVLALENGFNRVGIDHVILVKVASTAVATRMLGGDREQIVDALSNAWIDGHPLRTYRHAPNTGSRKSWAAGDATSRGVRLAMLTLQGEMGYPSALSAPKWGLQDVILKGKPVTLAQPLGSYVMENILFKVAFPAEFHAQTAVECAMQLHPQVRDRIDQIERIELTTHESAVRIISKVGPLHNYADRDHCLQYMVAVPLLYGRLTADDYGDAIASDPRIDALRAKMAVSEEPQWSRDYLDPEKRSIANAVQIFFKDGEATERVAVEYPIGHRRRRSEGVPQLERKFAQAIAGHYPAPKVDALITLFSHQSRLEATPVNELMELLAQ